MPGEEPAPGFDRGWFRFSDKIMLKVKSREPDEEHSDRSEPRTRSLTRFARIRAQIDLSPHAGPGMMQAGAGARRR